MLCNCTATALRRHSRGLEWTCRVLEASGFDLAARAQPRSVWCALVRATAKRAYDGHARVARSDCACVRRVVHRARVRAADWRHDVDALRVGAEGASSSEHGSSRASRGDGARTVRGRSGPRERVVKLRRTPRSRRACAARRARVLRAPGVRACDDDRAAGGRTRPSAYVVRSVPPPCSARRAHGASPAAAGRAGPSRGGQGRIRCSPGPPDVEKIEVLPPKL